VPYAPVGQLSAGLRLMESLDCLSCHKLDGRGRGNAPDLTTIGMREIPTDWHDRHLARHTRKESAEWIASYGPVEPADLAAIEAALRTRVGMARAVEARSLAMERGCLGCHKLQGRGGDESVALDIVGLRPIGDLDFRGVTGPQTFTNYTRAHLIDPAGIVPGSQMPALGYTSEEADLLTTFVLSLRHREMPLAFTPRERLRRTLSGGTAPRLTGQQLFNAYCSACHGPQGEGRNYSEIGVRFPRIGSRDFLDVASDEFITKTLELGRPGRRMPALAAPGATMTKDDVTALIGYLRTLPGRLQTDLESGALRTQAAAIDLSRPDVVNGRHIYDTVCAGCHGAKGEGKVGPALANPGFQQAATPAFVAATVARGREGTPMPAFSRNSASYPRLTDADAADVAVFVTTGLD
jgi:cytochrome c oxidase cbb3-type subunit 3